MCNTLIKLIVIFHIFHHKISPVNAMLRKWYKLIYSVILTKCHMNFLPPSDGLKRISVGKFGLKT